MYPRTNFKHQQKRSTLCKTPKFLNPYFLTGVFRISQLAHATALLNQLLKKEKSWRWETEKHDAWLAIKQLLSSAEVLYIELQPEMDFKTSQPCITFWRSSGIAPHLTMRIRTAYFLRFQKLIGLKIILS